MPRLSKITMAIRPRERERWTARRSWAHSGTARRPSASRPVQVAVAPVHQPEAVLLEVLAGRLHPPLPGAASPRPDPGQGRVQGDLDLVLEVQIRVAEQPEQARQILWDQVISQRRIRDQVACGWRHR
jgi:hypothetical protein